MSLKTIGKIAVSASYLYALLFSQLAWADPSPSPSPTATPVFSLSVSPYSGGYGLDFGRLDPQGGRVRSEVTISVTSNLNTQYEVSASIGRSLCNGSGDCIPANNLSVYGVRGSNRYGTIRQEREYYISGPLYTSNTTGISDSFTAVFGVLPFADIKPGSYRGSIRFTLTPIGSTTQRPVYEILDIYAEVESAFDVSISGGEIHLVSTSAAMQTHDVEVDITGSYGKQFRITQEPAQAATSPEGKWLEWDSINVAGSGSKGASVISGPVPISFPKQVIYTSSPRGDADSFILRYSLGSLSGQPAGKYRTSIRYYLENVGTGQRSLIDILGLNVELTRVLDLRLTPEGGESGIVFRNLKPNKPPEVSIISVDVQNTSGKRYQIVQTLQADLTSKEGRVIPPGNFTVRTASLETKGTLRAPQFDAVQKGDTVLFISDAKGSPDRFQLMYGLTIPATVIAGEYTTKILYTLSEI